MLGEKSRATTCITGYNQGEQLQVTRSRGKVKSRDIADFVSIHTKCCHPGWMVWWLTEKKRIHKQTHWHCETDLFFYFYHSIFPSLPHTTTTPPLPSPPVSPPPSSPRRHDLTVTKNTASTPKPRTTVNYNLNGLDNLSSDFNTVSRAKLAVKWRNKHSLSPLQQLYRGSHAKI